jgi:hypothetical protein
MPDACEQTIRELEARWNELERVAAGYRVRAGEALPSGVRARGVA